jgi:O-acetyl-ADP-ribose deacetylase (regulator of RNase III)
VLAAIGGLTACNSTPSARRVAFDVIETLDVDESVKECMRKVVEEDYTQDEIQAFAEGADRNPPDEASELALEAFRDDLAESCNSAG